MKDIYGAFKKFKKGFPAIYEAHEALGKTDP